MTAWSPLVSLSLSPSSLPLESIERDRKMKCSKIVKLFVITVNFPLFLLSVLPLFLFSCGFLCYYWHSSNYHEKGDQVHENPRSSYCIGSKVWWGHINFMFVVFSKHLLFLVHEKETTRSWLLPLLLLLLLYCILKFILFYSYTNFLCCLGEVHMRCFDTFDSWDSKWGAKFNHFYVSILYTGKVGTNT